jgi:hypothetical protein
MEASMSNLGSISDLVPVWFAASTGSFFFNSGLAMPAYCDRIEVLSRTKRPAMRNGPRHCASETGNFNTTPWRLRKHLFPASQGCFCVSRAVKPHNQAKRKAKTEREG